MEEEESIQIIMLCEQEIWPDYHISQRLASPPEHTYTTFLAGLCSAVFCPRFCTFVQGILFVCLFVFVCVFTAFTAVLCSYQN